MVNFNVYIPLKKDSVPNQLIGVASALSVDRDGEKMSDNALEDMRRGILERGVNLFGNHEHQWENTLGAIHDCEIVDHKLIVKPTLDDPNTNTKIPMLLNKLAKGIMIGLSVGGNTTKEFYEYDKSVGKKVKVIDGVNLYEISVVGIPSNADSYLSLGQAIAKSAKDYCPVCYSQMFEKGCGVCYYHE